jgi:hypothetical protein
MGFKWLDYSRGLASVTQPQKRRGAPSHGGKAIRTTVQTRRSYTGSCECLECGEHLSTLVSHLRHVHGMSVEEYRLKHGADAPVLDEDERARVLEMSADASRKRYAKLGRCTCRACGKSFMRKKRAKAPLFCSVGCRKEGAKTRRRGTVHKCPTCGRCFYRPPSLNDQVYCSMSCRPVHPVTVAVAKEQGARMHEASVRRRTRACPVCGKIFVTSKKSAARGTPVTCSPSCRNAFFKMGFQVVPGAPAP